MRTFIIETTDSQCIVTWPYGGRLRLYFLSGLAFTLWASLGVILIPQQKFADFALASGIILPVAAGLFALTYWTVRLVLDATGLELHWTFFSFERKEQFSLDEIHRFQLETYQGSSYGHGRHRRQTDPTHRLRVVCQEGNADFHTPAGEHEVNDLCDQLNDFLSKLKTVD